MDTKDGGVGAMVDAIYEAFVQFAVMEVREVFEAFRSDRDAVGELYLYRMGDVTKPLVVVHADTVFCRPPKRQEVEREGMIVRRRLGSKEGLGADDRLGVALLWLLLKEFPQTAFLITDKEEQHQEGALAAARDLGDELARYPFLLQLDRRGTQHFAHYGHVTSEFMQALGDITGFDFEKGRARTLLSFVRVSGGAGQIWRSATTNLTPQRSMSIWSMRASLTRHFGKSCPKSFMSRSSGGID
jgi:hypothetical protein